MEYRWFSISLVFLSFSSVSHTFYHLDSMFSLPSSSSLQIKSKFLSTKKTKLPFTVLADSVCLGTAENCGSGHAGYSRTIGKTRKQSPSRLFYRRRRELEVCSEQEVCWRELRVLSVVPVLWLSCDHLLAGLLGNGKGALQQSFLFLVGGKVAKVL